MFAVPLVASARFNHKAGLLLRLGCFSGILVTFVYTVFAFVPVVDVKSSGVFAVKVGSAIVATNLVGAALYWRGQRLAGTEF